MKIFLDTEFQDNPAHRNATCDLISLGAIREDGVEFYAEAVEYDWDNATPWLMDNVFPHCKGPMMGRLNMATQFKEFCGASPEFWAYYATHDWWLVMQLYGGFMRIPNGWPQYVKDLRMLADVMGCKTFPHQSGLEHHALHDARWNLHFYDRIMGHPPRD